jgi:hypothetical protein
VIRISDFSGSTGQIITNTTKNEIATNIFVPFFIDAPSTRRNIVYLV